MTKRSRILAAVLVWAAGCAAPGSQDAGVRDPLGRLERRVLANGMAVVVKEDHRLPTLTAMLAYRVGSVNETPGLTGVSHFFEHMVFKGTGKYKRGDIDLVTYRCGGENNAFTTHDMTGYWFHVGSRHLDDVLDILADTMGNCTLDPEEFARERNTVLQEMNLWLDGPWGELEREMGKTLYAGGSYRHPVLGWREDVEKLTRDQMMAYYKAHYKPNRASLVVVGDVRGEDVFRRAEKFFGSIRAGPEDAPARLDAPQERERSLELKTEKTADRLLVAFRADQAGTETDIVLDVVSTLLGEGRTARLQKRLVEKEDLVGEGNLSVFNESRRHEGLFTIQAELALDAPVDTTREIVVEELEALRKSLVSDRELRRAKNILRAKFAFEIESQFELASKIGYFEALGLPRYVPEYMGRVEAVTAEQIRECARKVFRAENRTVAVGRAKAKKKALGPRPWALAECSLSPAPPPLREGGRGVGRHSAKAYGLRPKASSPQAPAFGEVKEVVLDNGLTVLVKPRRDVPVLAVQAFVTAGMLFEPEEKAGLSALAGDLLDEGVDDGKGRVLSAGQLLEAIEFVGGQFEAGPSGAEAKVLSEHASLAFDLVRDVLRYPSFPEERVERLREDQLAEIEAMDDDPQQLARRIFYEAAFRGHPFHRPSVGYSKSVEKLTREDVAGWHRRFFRPENTIVAVAGDVDPERALAEVRARFGDWKGPGEWQPPKPPVPQRQPEPRRVFRTYASSQLRVHLGHVGIDRASPDWFALRVLETVLCSSPGFTNRLARTVRDAEGLAYDVAGSITAGAGIVAGPFQVVLGVEAKDKDRGLDLVMVELRKFVADGPTAEEVEDARRYLLASFVSSWETTDDLASYLIEVRRYALGWDFPDRFTREISAVTPEAVRRAAEKHLDLKNLTVVGVGPVDEKGNLLKEREK